MAPLEAAAVAGLSRAGERADRFRVTSEGLSRLIQAGIPRLARYRRLTARGLGLLSGQPLEDMARIQELHDLYAFFDQAYPALVDERERRRTEYPP